MLRFYHEDQVSMHTLLHNNVLKAQLFAEQTDISQNTFIINHCMIASYEYAVSDANLCDPICLATTA